MSMMSPFLRALTATVGSLLADVWPDSSPDGPLLVEEEDWPILSVHVRPLQTTLGSPDFEESRRFHRIVYAIRPKINFSKSLLR